MAHHASTATNAIPIGERKKTASALNAPLTDLCANTASMIRGTVPILAKAATGPNNAKTVAKTSKERRFELSRA